MRLYYASWDLRTGIGRNSDPYIEKRIVAKVTIKKINSFIMGYNKTLGGDDFYVFKCVLLR